MVHSPPSAVSTLPMGCATTSPSKVSLTPPLSIRLLLRLMLRLPLDTSVQVGVFTILVGLSILLSSFEVYNQKFLVNASDSPQAQKIYTADVVQPLVPLLMFLMLSILAAVPRINAFFDAVMNKKRVFECLRHLFFAEPFGEFLIMIGVMYPSSPLSSLNLFGGLFILSNGLQVHRIQRRTTGYKAETYKMRAFCTASAFLHHVSSWFVVLNKETAVLIGLWRSTSILAHSLTEFKNYGIEDYHRTFALIRRNTVMCCMAIAIVALIWEPRSGGEGFASGLSDGLRANAGGHVIYLWFRLGRLQARVGPETTHHEITKIGLISRVSTAVLRREGNFCFGCIVS